jgi:hypothetical protein
MKRTVEEEEEEGEEEEEKNIQSYSHDELQVPVHVAGLSSANYVTQLSPKPNHHES